MIEYANNFFIDFDDLRMLIKAHGYDDVTAKCVAEYFDETLIGDVYLSDYINYRLPNSVKCFKTEDELLEFMDEEGYSCEDRENGDLRIYKLNNGYYFDDLNR